MLRVDGVRTVFVEAKFVLRAVRTSIGFDAKRQLSSERLNTKSGVATGLSEPCNGAGI